MESLTEHRIECRDCNTAFPVSDGVIDLLTESAPRRSLSQAVMEWKPFIKAYESRWFRIGPGFPLISGISFVREYAMVTQAAKLGGDEIVLDLGCGSGIYSRPFARILTRGIVAGLDLSAPMLTYAGSRARAEGLSNLVFLHANALALPFPEGEFDAVICCATIHLFPTPDVAVVLKEVCRVLKPGGRLAVSCLRNWIPGALSRKFAEWYSRTVGTNYFRPADLTPLLNRAGLDEVECLHARRYWLVMSATKGEV